MALSPHVTRACDVCYGAADSPWIDASQAAVWLLLGITVAVQAAFVAFFVNLRRRSRRAAAIRREVKLVGTEGGV